MAPVNIKYIVSFSSQDQCHKVNNIISGDGSKKWLSDCSDRSGKIEAVLQLEEPCQLAYIDIGTIWCSSLEIRVGRSDWPQTTEFQSLVPVVSLMTPVDCRLSRGSSVTKMFSKVDFSSDIAAQKWDRLQIICRQPFRKDVQLGVSFIRLKSSKTAPQPELKREDTSKPNRTDSENNSSRDVSSIQQHFFGKVFTKHPGRGSPAAKLRRRLLKISGSAENGSEQEQSLSRTAKLVLKASQNSEVQKRGSPAPVTPKRGLFSDHLAKQKAVPIEQELKLFFPSLKLNVADIEKLTVADLRHKFERKKRRKLTLEEKRTFSGLCEQFICTLLDDQVDSEASFVSAASHLSTPPRMDGHEVSNHSSSKIGNEHLFSPARASGLKVARDMSLPPASLKDSSTPKAKNRELVPSHVSTPLNRTCGRSDTKDGSVDTMKFPPPSPILKDYCPSAAFLPATSNCSDLHTVSLRADSAGQSRNVSAFDLVSESRQSHENAKENTTNSSGDESSLEEEECLSSVTYDDDDEEEEEDGDDTESNTADSSPSILASARAKHKFNVENVRRSYEKLYNLNTSQEKQSEEKKAPCQKSSSTCARKRKLDGVSSEMLPELGSGMNVSDDDGGEKDKVNNGDDESMQSPGSHTSSTVKGTVSSNQTILVPDSLPCTDVAFIGLGNKIASPRTPKGKVYRMLTTSHVQSNKVLEQQKNIVGYSPMKQGSKTDNRMAAGIDIKSDRTVAVGASSVSNGVTKQSAVDARPTAAVVEPEAFPVEEYGQRTQGTSKRGKRKGDRGRGKPKNPVFQSRGRGRGRRGRVGTVVPSVSVHKRDGNHEPAQQELVFCDKCYGEFPSDIYAGHHPFCVRPAVFEGDNENSVSPSEQREALIDDAVDYSECPICLERFPEDVLPVHASECGL